MTIVIDEKFLLENSLYNYEIVRPIFLTFHLRKRGDRQEDIVENEDHHAFAVKFVDLEQVKKVFADNIMVFICVEGNKSWTSGIYMRYYASNDTTLMYKLTFAMIWKRFLVKKSLGLV